MDTGIGGFSTTPTPPRTPPAVEAGPRPEPASDASADRAAAVSETLFGRRQDDERRTEFDAETGSLIYRLVDVASGIVVTQTPDEARLRLRAYLDRVETDRSAGALERTA